MIRHKNVVTMLRFYEIDPEPNESPPYDAVCTLVWENDNTIWIQGLHGKLTRKLLREFLKFCYKNDVHKIKAYRSLGHSLPLMIEVDNHLEISVESLVERFGLRE